MENLMTSQHGLSFALLVLFLSARGIHQWLVVPITKDTTMRGALAFSFLLDWTSCWTNSRIPGDTASENQRTHDAIMMSLLHQNDVATSFWRNNDVVISSCVRWEPTCFPLFGDVYYVIDRISIGVLHKGSIYVEPSRPKLPEPLSLVIRYA